MKPTKVGKSAVLADFSESTAEKSESTADFSASEGRNFHTKHSKKGCEPKSAAFAYLCTLSRVLKATFVTVKNQSSLSSLLSLA
ncbi:MAG: hypothetical protein IIW61_01200 [Bacteroidaceae bacterium]|nr:hypothetical protein [Bacteroidaceae bacterium]